MIRNMLTPPSAPSVNPREIPGKRIQDRYRRRPAPVESFIVDRHFCSHPVKFLLHPGISLLNSTAKYKCAPDQENHVYRMVSEQRNIDVCKNIVGISQTLNHPDDPVLPV